MINSCFVLSKGGITGLSRSATVVHKPTRREQAPALGELRMGIKIGTMYLERYIVPCVLCRAMESQSLPL